MVRKDIREINKLKFYTFLMENYADLYLNKYTEYISNISYKHLLKKHNIGNCFYHFFVIDFFDVYKEPYLYMYKEYINSLFSMIYEIYISLKGISTRELGKKTLKTEEIDKELLKKICSFGYTRNYLISHYEKNQNVINFKILRFGSIDKFCKNLQQTDKFANFINGTLNININNKNVADIIIIHQDKCYMQRTISVKYITSVKKNKSEYSSEQYIGIAEELYHLAQLACNYTEYRETCFMCQPKKVKSGRTKIKVTKTKNNNDMQQRIKVYNKCCPRCSKIFKNLKELANNNKRADVMKKSVIKYDKSKPFNPIIEREKRYKRLIALLNDITVEYRKKNTDMYIATLELIRSAYL